MILASLLFIIGSKQKRKLNMSTTMYCLLLGRTDVSYYNSGMKEAKALFVYNYELAKAKMS